jgi:PAS domain S-box-containing protein
MSAPRPHASLPATDGVRDLERETETRFRTMADHAPVLLWMAGIDGLCSFFNQGWLAFTGRTLAQEVGNGWAEGVHPEDFQRCMSFYLDAFVARRPFSMEYRLRRHDGVYRWVFDQGAPRYEHDGSFAGFIGSCVDVTAQREARDALELVTAELERQVKERTEIARAREVLLREVHHRVKNDLQVVSSVLRMQGRKLADPRAAAALEECQSRIDTVALIHESMYRSEDIARVSFSENVRTLSAAVFRAKNDAAHVKLEADVDAAIHLPVDRAVPCGLILHELLTNALRHAFPGREHGTVRVALGAKDDRVKLVVADDGVGLPADFESRRTRSLGWVLVSALSEQLEAVMSIDRIGGTTVTLEFPQAHRKRHAD